MRPEGSNADGGRRRAVAQAGARRSVPARWSAGASRPACFLLGLPLFKIHFLQIFE
jgi:hypothetical protein